MSKKSETPSWYDETKLRKAYYAPGYSGWVIDLGDGTCRFANEPLLGKPGPSWGDRVPLIKQTNGLCCVVGYDAVAKKFDMSKIIERYDPEGESSDGH